MSIVSNNIKYLRRLNGLTQEQFARKIAIKRSLLGAYEEARANPNITNLKNMASAFGISVDHLLKNDLRRMRETPDLTLPLNSNRNITISHSGQNTNSPNSTRVTALSEPQPLSKIMEKFHPLEPEIRTVSRQVSLKPINGQQTFSPPHTRHENPVIPNTNNTILKKPESLLPVFNNQISQEQNTLLSTPTKTLFPTVQWIGKNEKSQYLLNLHNSNYVSNLPVFTMPLLEAGYYRAFESGEDFPLPNAALIGTFVRNWYEIEDGMQYLFVVKKEGILYRKSLNQVKENGTLLLTSDIGGIATLTVAIQDVLEVWALKAFISTELPEVPKSFNNIFTLSEQLSSEINKLK